MTVAEKTEIRQIVLDVLQEVSERSGPPDRLMLFLYQFTGEFKEFRREMLDFKVTTEDFHREMLDFKVTTDGRLDNIEKNMFTKTDWETEKNRLIEDIGEALKAALRGV
jgi:hypothetical protein